jgi:uncharacterized membrane protein
MDTEGRTTEAPAGRGRIVGVDVARCLALVGMIGTHVIVARDADGLTLTHQLASGRASALFAVLAGVSLALVSGGSTPFRGMQRRATSVGLVVRALLVASLGLVLGGLETTIAVILTYYGVLFLLALPFLGLGARALVLLAAAWVVVVPVLSQLARQHLPPMQGTSPNPESLAHPVRLLRELLLTGYYPAVPWVAYLLAGLAIGRSDLTRRSTAMVLVTGGAALAALALVASRLLLLTPAAADALARRSGGVMAAFQDSIASGLFGTTPTTSWWWLAVAAPHSGTPFDLAHTIGTACLVLGLALLLGDAAPRIAAVVFGAGAMTLTLYSLHVILRTPQFLPHDDVTTYLEHLAIVLGIGAVYRLFRRRGPLEQAVGHVSAAAARAAGG